MVSCGKKGLVYVTYMYPQILFLIYGGFFVRYSRGAGSPYLERSRRLKEKKYIDVFGMSAWVRTRVVCSPTRYVPAVPVDIEINTCLLLPAAVKIPAHIGIHSSSKLHIRIALVP